MFTRNALAIKDRTGAAEAGDRAATTSGETMAKIAGRKKRIIVTTAVLAAIGGGAAFAYWSATGTGDGEAEAGQSVPFTIASQAATGGPLSPGGPTQTVAFTVTNPGSGVQNLTAVAVTIPGSWSAGTTLPCTADDFTVGTASIAKGAINPAGVVSGTVTVTMKNLATNQDSCKGVTVPLAFAAS
jgi:hypothetical protein